MTTKSAAVAETPPEPEPGSEDAQWAELTKELETDDPLEETTPPVEDAKPAEDKTEGEPEPAPKAPTVEEHKNVQAALRQARERERQANERLQGFMQAVQEMRAGKQAKAEPEEEKPKAPSKEEDPIGYFEHQIAELKGQLEEARSGTKQSTEQVQAELQEQRFWGEVERSVVEMRGKTPDYDDAVQHLETARIAELEVILPDDSPRAQAIARQNGAQSPAHLRAVMLNRDRILVAQQAFQLGMSPADLYYRLAKQRGFVGGTTEPGKLNGKTPAAKPNPAIEAAKRGQKAARTISGGEGGKSDNDLSLSDLSDLYADDPEEFDKMWDKMAKAGKLG